jgi:bifunctional non-homologous end joining protein LigD
VQPFARAMAELLEREHGDLVLSDMAKNLRVGKVFIDWSQNADHKTTIGVYSLRAKRPRPYVSVPVRWEELTKALQKKDADFLEFEPQRLNRVGDLFAPVLELKQRLPKGFASLTTPPKRKTPARLADYQAKRNFARTTEPSSDLPRRSTQGSRRRFVVQKHAASHLHYDLRLEMHDVLKSWAVPKGAPLKNNETHTAFQTEDHPVEYLQFEGIIPRGVYGAGTVMVWDIGTYEIVEGNDWKGAISIFLRGKKLKGEWSLQRLESDDEKTKWLLRKTNGDAQRIPARREDISALSGRNMEKIAGDKSAIWNSSQNGSAPVSPKKSVDRKHRLTAPRFVRPMKATAVTQFPEDEEWIYEVKWDGYRVLALKDATMCGYSHLKNGISRMIFPA